MSEGNILIAKLPKDWKAPENKVLKQLTWQELEQWYIDHDGKGDKLGKMLIHDAKLGIMKPMLQEDGSISFDY
jgi:hypothetical protein